MMKKARSKDPAKLGAQAAKWRQAFQRPAAPDPACPAPEQVIGAALQELAAPQQQQIQDHLLTCRDCLNLYLDVRSAQAAADSLEDQEVIGMAPAELQAGRLAVWGRKVREALQALGRPRRLVPALAAVSLVVLVFILGRQEKSLILPPPQPVLEKRAAPAFPPQPMPEPQALPAAPPCPTPSVKPEAVKPIPGPVTSGLIASKPQAETLASLQKKSRPAAGALAAPLHLDVAAVPGGARLSYRADQDAYAYLLRADRDGKFSLLHSGGIKAGRTYYYPERDKLPKAAAPGMKTTVFLIASTTPVPDLKTRLDELQHLGQDRLQTLFPQATIRSLAVRLP